MCTQEKSPKVIFLDFDGVINDTDYRYEWFPIFEEHMENLDYIVQETGAMFVLSTAHRNSKRSIDKFTSACKKLGWKNNRIIGKTIDLQVDRHYNFESHEKTRTDEINRYLKTHPEIKIWVAVDDIDLTVEHFVQMLGYAGLTKERADEVIKVLNRFDKSEEDEEDEGNEDNIDDYISEEDEEDDDDNVDQSERMELPLSKKMKVFPEKSITSESK